ncbi:pyroglutamyl-peptidase I [Planctomycetota bacterium]
MKKVLITAFEPFDVWSTNSSWLTLVELTKDLPDTVEVTTRLYPVDFAQVQQRLEADLETEFDVTLHLGQSSGATEFQLESIALNVASENKSGPFRKLVDDGPTAMESELPIHRFATTLRSAGIPASVSFHAGTYLCNAIFYLSSFIAKRNSMKTRCGFIHLPLTPSQTANHRGEPLASMPAPFMAGGLRLILEEIARSTHGEMV